jgi:hypothetical protein
VAPPVADSASPGIAHGASTTAAAFGANVTLPMEGSSLFFVVGRAGPPDAIVNGFNGRVVTRLPDGHRVLAVLPLAAYTGLLEHRDVAAAGPVSVDRERFHRFAQLIGLDEAHPP